MRKPLLLHYYITNRCNSKCVFCSIWKEMPKADAASEHVLRNLRDGRMAGCKFVDFTGGEPLLHKDLPLFLSEAKKLGYITSVTTNCLLFEEQASRLAGLIDLLHFSLDGDTPKMHNSLHGSNSYDSVVKSIPAALSNRLVPDILFTYSDENIDSFSGVYDMARFHRLMVILDPVFNTDGKDTVSQETHKKALTYSRLPGVYLNKAHILLRKQGGNSVEKPVCRAVTSTIVIMPDNRMALPCYHHKMSSIEIGESLRRCLGNNLRKNVEQNQGRYPFCAGCHINCYLDPSYMYKKDAFFINSAISKLYYIFKKYLFFGRIAHVGIVKSIFK